MKSLAYLVGSAICVAACGPPTPVTVTELGTNLPPPASEFFAAVDVSDTGHIVGRYDYNQVAVFLDNGEAVLLPIPAGYRSCQAVAVANDGKIAGTCQSVDEARPRVFFAQSAQATLQFILFDGDVGSEAQDMNAHGVILGNSYGVGGTTGRRWTYDTSSGEVRVLAGFATIPTSSSPAAINDVGDVASTASFGSSSIQAVRWSADTGTVVVLAAPTESMRGVSGIDNRGGVIGDAVGPLAVGSAVFWPSASAAPEILPYPAPRAGKILTHTHAAGLNDDGFIVGYASYSPLGSDPGVSIGVVWTPDRRIIELGEDVFPEAINASGVMVGRRRNKPVRIELDLAAR